MPVSAEPRRFDFRAESYLAAAAGALALSLQIWAIHGHSLSGDGAYHLVAGHQALRYGQNTVNFEHPPLVKLIVALPLLLEPEPLAASLTVEDALATSNRVFGQPAALRRATIRGRYLALAAFVVPFLIACFSLGRRFGDRRTGVVLALMIAFSLSALPYLSVLQTDTAVALAFLLMLLLAARYVERPGLGGAAWLGLAAGFGLAVKFSAALLAPTVLLGVLLAPLSWRRRLGHLAIVGFVAVTTLRGAYLAANRNYSSELGREQISAYCANRGTLVVDERMRAAERALLEVERIDPWLAQWLTGFWGVRVQNAIGVYPSFAFGEIRSAGRWWYFPAVLAIKTPIVILLVALLALGRFTRDRFMHDRCPPKAASSAVARSPWILLGMTVAVYLGVAMTSSYNLSVRHMLPVLPLLYLPIARAVSRIRFGAATLVTALVLESIAVAPLWMSQTNTWWLGSHNPTRFALAAGNLEYRQNFIQLARQAEARGLDRLGVLYPAIGEEVVTAYLPHARLIEPGDALEPGWYAVSVMVEQFVPALLEAAPEQVYGYRYLRQAATEWQPLWHAVRRGEDHGYVAGTFHLYRLPGARDPPGDPAAGF